MKNIFGLTREDLEEYFLSIGEKNLKKQLKYLNGYIFIKNGI